MGIVKVMFDPNDRPKLTSEEAARLDAMTDAEIIAAALSDPNNPPLTEVELERIRAVQIARAARTRAGLSQRAFAETFRISLGRLRDIEQGRRRPDSAVVAYLEVIAADPGHVMRTLAQGAEPN